MPIHHCLIVLLLSASSLTVSAEPDVSAPPDLLSLPTEAAKAPAPDVEALKRSLAAIKELHLAEYATPKARAALIPTLIDQALQNQEDPGARYALLHEARELAIAAKEVDTVVALCEQLAQAYQGPDVTSHLRTCLGRITGVAVVPALLKLLDVPSDPAANAVVGRWYANEVQDWQRALPLLAQGNDAATAKVAANELLAPAKASERMALADQWYDLGKRTTTMRESFWRHALGLYDGAKAELTGLNLALAEKRMAEIEATLPLGADLDYSHLSAGQWERLKGRIVSVDAERGINPTAITLSEGQRVRVVPHPTETWKVSDSRGINQQTTWKGGMAGRRAAGSLQCVVGKGLEQSPGIVSGSGQLMLFPLVPGKRFSVTGTIRVKIIPISD